MRRDEGEMRIELGVVVLDRLHLVTLHSVHCTTPLLLLRPLASRLPIHSRQM